MAEELGQGGVSWWNSPRNLFGSSACSNDIGWHDLISDTKSVHSPADANPPDACWNQDLLRDRENNYCNFLLDDSTMNYRPQINSTQEDSPAKQSFGGEQTQSLSSSAESYSYASSLLHTLFDTDDSQPHQSLLDHQTPIPSHSAYHFNSNGFLHKSSPPANRLWNNASLTTPSPPSHLFGISNTDLIKNKFKDSAAVVKKASNEPTFKRPRIETPSPLPTFKVRKEKLGDRITALQQLVSPFGKTDTASVLHEAIEYIKFLHDQVNALSTPYLKYGSPPVQRQQVGEKSKEEDKDLKTRGLCLVPISSTFPVAAETTSDFWTPTFGGSFR